MAFYYRPADRFLRLGTSHTGENREAPNCRKFEGLMNNTQAHGESRKGTVKYGLNFDWQSRWDQLFDRSG